MFTKFDMFIFPIFYLLAGFFVGYSFIGFLGYCLGYLVGALFTYYVLGIDRNHIDAP